MAEISCHGSAYVVRTLLHTLSAQGARVAVAGEFTRRAFVHGKLDLPQAEAVADLIEAEGEASHTLAVSQLRGNISAMVQTFREQMIDFAALLELELDFSEEDLVFAQREELQRKCQQLREKLGELLQSFYHGRAIKDGIRMVIAGKPNVGKSTLFNTLLKENKAIVSATEGTTRDYLEAIWWIGGTKALLFDTAGIRKTALEIEKEGVQRSKYLMKEAHALLWVFDITKTTPQTLRKETQRLSHPHRKLFLIGNKEDRLSPKDAKTWKDFRMEEGNIFPLSAQKHTGIKTLVAHIQSEWGKTKKNQGTLISHARHYRLLQHTDQAIGRVIEGIQEKQGTELLAADLREGLNKLGELTGKVHNEEILQSIFQRFCIGK